MISVGAHSRALAASGPLGATITRTAWVIVGDRKRDVLLSMWCRRAQARDVGVRGAWHRAGISLFLTRLREPTGIALDRVRLRASARYAALAQLVRAPDCGSGGPPFEPGRRYHSFLPARLAAEDVMGFGAPVNALPGQAHGASAPRYWRTFGSTHRGPYPENSSTLPRPTNRKRSQISRRISS